MLRAASGTGRLAGSLGTSPQSVGAAVRSPPVRARRIAPGLFSSVPMGGTTGRACSRFGKRLLLVPPWQNALLTPTHHPSYLRGHSCGLVTPSELPHQLTGGFLSGITWLDHTGPTGHVPSPMGFVNPPGVRQSQLRWHLRPGAATAWNPCLVPHANLRKEGSSAGVPRLIRHSQDKCN